VNGRTWLPRNGGLLAVAMVAGHVAQVDSPIHPRTGPVTLPATIYPIHKGAFSWLRPYRLGGPIGLVELGAAV
jgi:hypothetical protein